MAGCDTFAEGFLWGAATSAYQIEGSPTAAGKGESIWDRFVRRPDTIANGDSGEVACDHYSRWRGDVSIMQELGINAYRFSIAWTRVLPTGTGTVNQAGLDFYDRLVDALLESGIEPVATLYHWDLPQAIEDGGGWRERSTVEAFAAYAGAVAGRIADRVRWWITVNEPRVVAQLGHETGEFAPGISDERAWPVVAHHLLLAHGRAAAALRAVRSDASIGIALDPNPVVPSSSNPGDVAAARLRDGKDNRWYLDPLAGRPYPADVVAAFGADSRFVAAGDMETIATPIDFLGVNYYRRELEGSGDTVTPLPRTAMGWEIYPQGLAGMLIRLRDEYPFASYLVSENGAAFEDVKTAAGVVDDPQRIEYLRSHLASVATAMNAGVPVVGYLVWSLLDNFEWTQGYGKRFGLVHVDFATQERTVKSSGYWYRDLVARWRAATATGEES
ncbi:MAG: GH1 family beta-glucosidase [Acidimicrobiia bacterium]